MTACVEAAPTTAVLASASRETAQIWQIAQRQVVCRFLPSVAHGLMVTRPMAHVVVTGTTSVMSFTATAAVLMASALRTRNTAVKDGKSFPGLLINLIEANLETITSQALYGSCGLDVVGSTVVTAFPSMTSTSATTTATATI